MEIAEISTSQHSTQFPTDPTELFDGALRVGDMDLEDTTVNVWSCGCVLLVCNVLWGASPSSECELHEDTGKTADCRLQSIQSFAKHTQTSYQQSSSDKVVLFLVLNGTPGIDTQQ